MKPIVALHYNQKKPAGSFKYKSSFLMLNLTFNINSVLTVDCNDKGIEQYSCAGIILYYPYVP